MKQSILILLIIFLPSDFVLGQMQINGFDFYKAPSFHENHQIETSNLLLDYNIKTGITYSFETTLLEENFLDLNSINYYSGGFNSKAAGKTGLFFLAISGSLFYLATLPEGKFGTITLAGLGGTMFTLSFFSFILAI